MNWPEYLLILSEPEAGPETDQMANDLSEFKLNKRECVYGSASTTKESAAIKVEPGQGQGLYVIVPEAVLLLLSAVKINCQVLNPSALKQPWFI